MARTSGILVSILLCACLYVVSSAVIEQKAAASNGVAAPVNRQLLREQAAARVEKINKSGKKWKAKLYPKFANQTMEELRRWLGLAMDPSENIKHRQERAAKLKLSGLELEKKKKKTTTTQAPTTTTSTTTQAPTTTTEEPEDDSFDAREEWPECADVIGKIQDQSGCGSCWAVSSASVMQDRICIASEGKKKVNISTEDVMSCVTKSYGCSGGWPQHAFEFYQEQGVCTGSDYESKLGCKPYPIPPHADHMYRTPRCKKRCENRKYKENKYKNDKHFGQEPVNLQDSEEEDIMEAIQEGGPVVASMIVYDDFFAYSEGVYEASDDAEQAGGHAVRIIGWGYDEEADIPYWLVANSWNTDWGMDGYFKIARGQDECYIESWGINYSEPDLDHAAVAH